MANICACTDIEREGISMMQLLAYISVACSTFLTPSKRVTIIPYSVNVWQRKMFANLANQW